MTRIEVGSLVRVPRMTKNHSKSKAVTGRALVATVQEDAGTVCLLWEAIAPQPLNSTQGSKQKNKKSPFLVTPVLSENNSEEEETEMTVPLDAVMELLPFERQDVEDTTITTMGAWKDCGDQLLRLGDASAAVPYYEQALIKSSNLQIGSTIIVQVQGYPKIAEVDCIEDNDKGGGDSSLDIEVVDTGTEMTISASQVLLCICQSDEEKLQERTLLNLSRCLLQLAEIDDPAHRTKYLKAVVLSCTLALTVSTYYDEGKKGTSDNKQSIPPNGQTALQLRARAYGNLSKWSHAMADAKRLISQGEVGDSRGRGNSVGHKLLDELQRQQKQQVKTDKRLAKAVCQWVETATTSTTQSEDAVSNEVESAVRGKSNAPNQPPKHEPDKETTHPKVEQQDNDPTHNNLTFWFPLLLSLGLAIFIQKYVVSHNRVD